MINDNNSKTYFGSSSNGQKDCLCETILITHKQQNKQKLFLDYHHLLIGHVVSEKIFGKTMMLLTCWTLEYLEAHASDELKHTCCSSYVLYFDVLFRFLFVCLFELMLYVPVNSQGHVGTLPPLYGTFTQNEDVMTSNKCLKY